ncbi:MAG TPA: type II toxin-antitoxin system PemK/MazF family toxin [Vicinamibacteria bacterium]|nr:type II toxin-antitoxin system PemK/MazF family toxin [Vicinamibacteria bacterium]
MERGEVWWGALPAPTGSGPGYRRPVVVVQANSFNRSGIRTVVIAAITSNTALAAAPGNVAISRRESGLEKASVVNVSQLLTVDRRLLVERVRTLPARTMDRVDDGLRQVLDL